VRVMTPHAPRCRQWILAAARAEDSRWLACSSPAAHRPMGTQV